MKRYDDIYGNFDKQKARQVKGEESAGGFKCSHCKLWVVINAFIGTANRNHCNICLWSKHVDENKGDRKANCQAGMEPVGLTFKHEGHGRVGELMLVHRCARCFKLSINRIAGDDMEHEILSIFDSSSVLDERLRARCKSEGIVLLTQQDAREVHVQLFGKSATPKH